MSQRSEANSNISTSLPRDLTPKQYADAVFAHAQRGIEASLFPGHNYDFLASYLQRPFVTLHPGSLSSLPHTSESKPVAFVRSYAISRSGVANAQDLHRYEDLPDSIPSSRESSSHIGLLLFLKGQPTSLWLSHLGAKYLINPEFFQRHLSFCAKSGRLDYHCLPSLPSSSVPFLQLSLFTIGRQDGGRASRDPRRLDRLRDSCSRSMGRYLDNVSTNLHKGSDAELSIIRDFWMLDERDFAMQQDASVHLVKGTHGWICVVWSDSSRNLVKSFPGPWWKDSNVQHASQTRFYPTIQSVPKSILKSHQFSIKDADRPPRDCTQSSNLLPLVYGKTLDPSILAIDPFYAVHELCVYSAYSQAQFLNLMHSKISAETYQNPEDTYSTTVFGRQTEWNPSNLLYYEQILDVNVVRLRENVDSITARGGLGPLPPPSNAVEEKANAIHQALLSDYQSLLNKNESLAARCRQGLEVLNNRAMIAESNKAINQAQEVTKLTRLAFIYIPLSFTAAVFGMNVDPIVSDSKNSIWVWFVFSVPILGISLAAMQWDISRPWKKVTHRKKAQPASD